MTHKELQEHILKIVSDFFVGATVLWQGTNATKPAPPLVTIHLGNIKRSTHPITQWDDGIPVSYYPSTAPLKVNLYTQGESIKIGNETAYINTAVSDLTDFCNYIDSPEVNNYFTLNDFSILLSSDIQDLSSIIDDIDAQYRAYAEFTVDFTQMTAGAFNARKVVYSEDSNNNQNSSGGGSDELAKADTGYFTSVEITEEKEVT